MNSIIKRMVTVVLLVCMMVGVLAVLPVMAEERTLTTDKTVYEAGEPIYVTATGSGTDWIGLYEANPTAQKTSAAYWYYIAQDGHSSGDTVDIHNADYVNASDCPHMMGIPAGEYKIVLCPNNGYEIAKEVYITVKEPTPPDDPSSVLKTDKTEYREGESILVTGVGKGNDWIGLYKADDDIETSVVGYWYYVAKDGNTSGQEVDFQLVAQFDGYREDIAGIPAGEYKLVFFFNGTYQPVTETYFTVKPIGKAEPPASVVYQSAGKGAGHAAGTVTVTAADGPFPFAYEMWWGNADGPLAGYTSLGQFACTGKKTVVTLPDHTAIPAGADRILVYATNNSGDREGLISDQPTAGILPDDVAGYNFGEVKKEFAILGDLHLFPNNEHLHNQQFAAALADIRQVAPGVDGIFINGDVTDHGTDGEFAAFRAILEAAGELPPVYAAIGDHDLYGQGTDAMRIDRFLKGTGNSAETVYFDVWVKGIHCIFLGSEKLTTNDAELSAAQLAWLSDLLAKDKAEGKTAFVFLHQGLSKTVDGTRGGQSLDGVAQEDELRAILKEHPEVILFSGHSHWTLEDEHGMFPATSSLPNMFNTAAVSYLMNTEVRKLGSTLAGSQGLYVTVYEKHMVVAARDFVTGEWLTNSLFVVDWTHDLASDTPDTTPAPPAETETETDPVETAESTPIETADVESVTVSDTETIGDPAESTADTETDAPDTGCASQYTSVGVCALLSISALALTVCARRKKED